MLRSLLIAIALVTAGFSTLAQQMVSVPVVFHVVYNTAAQNISDAQLFSQLDVLNEDFNKQNADTILIPGPFKQSAASANITFCLARTDPGGQASSGITRTYTTVQAFTSNSNSVKFNTTGGHTAWPKTRYLNIWVCNLANGVLGYSQLPGGTAATDGVVLHYQTVGRAPANPFPGPYNLGRTGTRETGHWLGLYTPGMAGTCSSQLDLPPQDSIITGCPAFPFFTGCASPFGAQFMNFMQLTDDACRQMFTQGQVNSMKASVFQHRPTFMNSYNCGLTQSLGTIGYSGYQLAGQPIQFYGYEYDSLVTWQWQFPGGTPNSSVQNNPVVTYNTAGTYQLTATVKKGNDSVVYTPSLEIFEHAVTGKVFYDMNLNGVKDPGELGAVGRAVNIGANTHFTGSDGIYIVYTNDTSAIVSAQAPLYYTLSPAYHSVSFTGTGQLNTGKNFALQPIPGKQDLRLQFFSSSTRPGSSTHYTLECKNAGTITVNGILEFQFDPQFNLTAVPAGAVLSSPNVLQWNLPAFQPNEDTVLHVSLSLASTVSIGTQLHGSITLLPVTGDLTPADNQHTLTTTVTGSFDPNDKQVNMPELNPAQVAAALPLDYHIRFQNTGTDTAFSVIIRDTLDPQLDETTLELSGASHAYSASFDNQSRLLEWKFTNILLPDSNRNEPGSHGFVSYRVQPRATLQVGDLILNSAFIYFDVNAPVQTNTAFTEVVTVTAATDQETRPVWQLFPNPATEEVRLTGPGRHGSAELFIYNALGQPMSRQLFTASENETNLILSVRNLPAGLFLIRVIQGSIQQEFRLVKH